MKRTMKLFLTAVLILSVALAGVVVARGWNHSWEGRGMGPGHSQNYRGMGPGHFQNYRGMGPGHFQSQRGMQPGNFQQPWNMMGLGALLRDEMNQAQAEVLAEVTGQSQADIQAQMKTKPFPLLLEEYQVNPEDFEAKLHVKVVLLVNQAVKDGKLTQEQANAIFQRMAWMSRQHVSNQDENPES